MSDQHEPGRPFADRIALITGAGGGIGAGIARGLAERGAHVVVCDIAGEAAEGVTAEIVAAGCQATAFRLDVRSAEQCLAAAAFCRDRFGRVDMLVNNAGVAVAGNALTLSEEDWDRILDTNVKGAFLVTRAVLPLLVEAGKSSVVIMSSMAGVRGAPNALAYSTSKHALLGFAQCLAVDHGRQGVRVNAICPGPVRTELMKVNFAAQTAFPDFEDYLTMRAAGTLLNRIGDVEDIVKACVFLLGDESSWVTGSTLIVDGGALQMPGAGRR